MATTPTTGLVLDGSSPLDLDDTGRSWLLATGDVDLFVVPVAADGLRGRRYHVGSVGPGCLLTGVSPLSRDGTTWHLVAVGMAAAADPLPGTWSDRTDDVIDRGLRALLSALAETSTPPGSPVEAAEHDVATEVSVAAGQPLVSRERLVWWRPDSGTVAVRGVPVPAGVPVPLTSGAYLAAVDDGTGQFLTSSQLTAADRQQGLDWLLGTALGHVATAAAQRASRAAARSESRRRQESLARAAAVSELTSLGRADVVPARTGDDPLLAAFALLEPALGTPVVAPPDWSGDQGGDPIRAIARASAIRIRAVTLEEGWWLRGLDAMLAFREPAGTPVALVPRAGGGYRLLDPATGTQESVTATVASQLRPTGYVAYPPLPGDSLSVRDLLRFGLRGSRRDLVRMLAFSVVAGVVSLAIPIATGVILGNLVPQGQVDLILGASLAVFLIVLAGTGFLLGRSGSLLRLQGRMLGRMQAGIWDRLLALPAEFYRRYSVADLTMRASGVEMIQMIISTVASQTLLALVTLVMSLVLLFAYSPSVAGVVVAVTLVVVAISATMTVAQIRRLRRMYDAKGEASGMLLQLVQGVDKVRAAAAEGRALDQWSRRFAVQARYLLSSQRFSAVRTGLYAALPVMLTFTVFLLVGQDPGLMSTSAFLGFIAALGQITAATTQLDLSLGYVLNILPIFDRMRPILEEPVEVAEGAADPGPLTGRVALNDVTFRYPGMSATVLDDLSLSIEPGQFVAVVGASGSGKSTLVRLLLGFEHPEAGSVTYDSKDLASLDARAVRAQIGVALQNATVTGGDILSAIRGDWPITEDQAWLAAERVGLADDIRALPMGMRTMLGGNAATFSGGQRQRLILAAAIARSPRLVVLDEATSALDSVTQAHVTDSFQRLHVTRIVIAHRLSTIRGADRIVVLDRGRIVQTGTYDDLVAHEGPFRDMAVRQQV